MGLGLGALELQVSKRNKDSEIPVSSSISEKWFDGLNVDRNCCFPIF